MTVAQKKRKVINWVALILGVIALLMILFPNVVRGLTLDLLGLLGIDNRKGFANDKSPREYGFIMLAIVVLAFVLTVWFAWGFWAMFFTFLILMAIAIAVKRYFFPSTSAGIGGSNTIQFQRTGRTTSASNPINPSVSRTMSDGVDVFNQA